MLILIALISAWWSQSKRLGFDLRTRWVAWSCRQSKHFINDQTLAKLALGESVCDIRSAVLVAVVVVVSNQGAVISCVAL